MRLSFVWLCDRVNDLQPILVYALIFYINFYICLINCHICNFSVQSLLSSRYLRHRKAKFVECDPYCTMDRSLDEVISDRQVPTPLQQSYSLSLRIAIANLIPPYIHRGKIIAEVESAVRTIGLMTTQER